MLKGFAMLLFYFPSIRNKERGTEDWNQHIGSCEQQGCRPRKLKHSVSCPSQAHIRAAVVALGCQPGHLKSLRTAGFLQRTPYSRVWSLKLVHGTLSGAILKKENHIEHCVSKAIPLYLYSTFLFETLHDPIVLTKHLKEMLRTGLNSNCIDRVGWKLLKFPQIIFRRTGLF